MRIGIDFDRVIFDTDSFIKYLMDKTMLEHVEENVFDKNGCYSIKKHAKQSNADLEKINKKVENCSQFLYNDVKKINSIDEHDFIIVSRGQKDFQMKKIKCSGVEKYFEEVVIVQEKDKDVAGINFLVDDSKEELERVKIPGMLFDREKHTMEDVISKIGEL